MSLTDEETRGLIHVTLAETTGLQREIGCEIETSRRELLALERDTAISLLLEVPTKCSRWVGVGTCGECSPCRVDKFLRDVGARKG